MVQEDATTTMTNAVVVVFDVGSSSLRCTLYQVDDHLTILSHASVVRRSVEPRDGSIVNVEGLLDDLEHLLDEALRRATTDATSMLTVQAIGFSTFCMNLIGLDRSTGRVVATFSYASQSSSSPGPFTNDNDENDDDDADDVVDNHKPTDQQVAEHLYQATGTYNCRHHPSYAPLHLRRFYHHDRCSGTKTTTTPDNTVEWHTIASYAYRRWFRLQSSPSSRPIITYGEASWTGLLNLHTCDCEPVVLNYIIAPPSSRQPQQPQPQQCSDASSLQLLLGLPTLVPTNVPVGIWTKDTINETYYRRWPCLDGAQLFGGIPDGFAATIGSKCSGGSGGGGGGSIATPLSSSKNDTTATTAPAPATTAAPMRIAVTMGTTAAARVVVEYPKQTMSSSSSSSSSPSPTTTTAATDISSFVVPSGLFAYRIDDKHVLLGGALNDGGSVLEWARELLNLGNDFTSPLFLQCLTQATKILEERYRDLEDNDRDGERRRRRSLVPPSRQHHLSMLPLLSGERSTGFRTHATGAMLGLTRDVTPAHFLLSCMEGVVLRLHAIITLLRRTQGATTTTTTTSTTIPPIIVISGKALETNTLWRQMLADCTGLSVVYDATTTEGTSRGVAKYMMAAGCFHNNDEDDDDPYAMEELVESSRNDPTTSAGAVDRYWQMAAAQQQQLLDAVDPLFFGQQL
jgi:gluconokinase